MGFVVRNNDELHGLPDEPKIKAAACSEEAAEIVEVALFSEGGAIEVSTVMFQK